MKSNVLENTVRLHKQKRRNIRRPFSGLNNACVSFRSLNNYVLLNDLSLFLKTELREKETASNAIRNGDLY